MDNITLGQISNLMVWLLGFGGSTVAIVTAVKKAIAKGFEPIERKIDEVDKNATKNYLVSTISQVDRDGWIDSASKIRFYEQYEHYTKPVKDGGLGGNTYIHDEVERLKKEGKL